MKDLNTKKSWHPGIQRNQNKVQQSEIAALQERKKIAERQREIEEEAVIEGLQANLTQQPGRGLAWMYQGTGSGGTAEAANEQYLLGRRRVDTLLERREEKTTGGMTANEYKPQNYNPREDMRRSLADPLLEMQRGLGEVERANRAVATEGRNSEKRRSDREDEKRRQKKERRRHKLERRALVDSSDSSYLRGSTSSRQSSSDLYEHRQHNAKLETESSRSDKLAEMQANAVEHDKARSDRLARFEARDEAESALEQRRRERPGANFLTNP